ncbi:MAG: DUF1999 family protein [Trueperaceae bacterium]|nr:DUF1999 family protein [Trueperaceae bacterium]
MGEMTLIRSLSQEDFEPLKAIDESYAKHYSVEPMLTLGSLNFYARTGHAFASLRADHMTGFVLAQSVWNGFRPVLQMNRLAVADPGDEASISALLEALTKSAYDAAVYDLQLLLPKKDTALLSLAEQKDYRDTALIVLGRTLGSRGQKEV